MYNSICRLSLILLAMGLYSSIAYNRKHIWEVDNLWSSCSVTCGVGIRYQLNVCVRKTLYGTREIVNNEKCKTSTKPLDRMVESCFYGNCPDKKTDEYVWKVSEWSTCSKSCGGNGIRTREVICVLASKTGILLDVPYSNCKAVEEPTKAENCAFSDCPPEFVTTPWNKCTKVRECRPGIRRRKMKCIVTLRNGKITRISSGHCYRAGKPPIGWEFCLNDPSYQEKCRFRREIEKKKVPVVLTSNSILHQMRKINKLRLTVGQTAYVLPYASIVIKCQVTDFSSSNLQWIRKNRKYSYIGKSNSRVSVSRRGALVIKKFLLDDEGYWYCVAKNVSAFVQLFAKSPSKGYEDWISRNIYRKESIIGIKSAVQYHKSTSYQWVAGPWSVCSKTCGEKGLQTRRVNCEEITTQYFVQVDKDICSEQKLQKPNNIRMCNGLKYCPQWMVVNASTSKCGNSCVDIKTSLLEAKILCKYKDRVLPDARCMRKSKPSLKCFNENCEPYWKIGSWSKCSKSCGTSGIRARTMECLWRPNGLTAKNHCYRLSLKLPKLVEPCQPPPCILGCVDLSEYCGVKKLCRIRRYQFYCCRTCFQS